MKATTSRSKSALIISLIGSLGLVVLIVATLFLGKGGNSALKHDGAPSDRSELATVHSFDRSLGAGSLREKGSGGLPKSHLLTALGVSVDLEGLRVLQFREKWVAKANSGDASAAFHVYEAESVCANLEKLKVIQKNDPAFGESYRDQLALTIRDSEEACSDVTPALVSERFDFLRKAAAGGNSDAQVAFFKEGPGYDRSLADAIGSDPAVDQWKKDAVTYLKSAASQGNSSALLMLAFAYSDGTVVQQDQKTALMYATADAMVRTGDPAKNPMIKNLWATLSSEDAAAARNAGIYLASQCCNVNGQSIPKSQ